MLIIEDLVIPGYQRVVKVTNPEVNLQGFIAIHDTSLGPALGGIRIYPYSTPQEALDDVLQLAKCMTYKSASIANGLGGGKSVIIANPATEKTEPLLRSFGKAIHALQGAYIAAEDVGTTPEDMISIRKSTPYVVALPLETGSGDPSRFTAFGVFRGMQAVAQTLWGSPSLHNRTVLIQGLGNVGSKLASHLFWAGANLIFSELNEKTLHAHCLAYGTHSVSQAELLQTPCDILSPCALGGTINPVSIDEFSCKAIAGSANNQLTDPLLGHLLKTKGVLYAPDYVINSGGIINVAGELDPIGYQPKLAWQRVDQIYNRLLEIFIHANNEGKSTSQVADEIAEYNLLHKIGQRQTPINFSLH